jgi:hypothetical protein
MQGANNADLQGYREQTRQRDFANKQGFLWSLKMVSSLGQYKNKRILDVGCGFGWHSFGLVNSLRSGLGKHELKIGDWVDYKPARMHGYYKAKVLAFNERTRRVCVEIYLSDGSKGRTTWITDRGILAVYDETKNRKSQAPVSCAADQRLIAARFQISPRILLKIARRRLSHVIPADLAICRSTLWCEDTNDGSTL